MAPAEPPPAVVRATRSVYGVFALAGAAIASLLSRVPQVRDLLGLRPGALGVVLLMTAIGALLALPTSGLVVDRVGPARTVAGMAVLATGGVAVAAVGSEVGPVVVGIGMFAFGFGNAQWDVAMNVEAAAVEQHLGRSVMSRFHAAFSLGTVAGALGGVVMNALGIAPVVHLPVVAVLVLVGVEVSVRGFLPVDASGPPAEHGPGPLRGWAEPRTVLIGVFVLCMAFAEGTANDWLGIAAIDGYGASDATGSVAFVLFVASMTVGRWFGPGTLDRCGRVPVLRGGALLALVGVLAVVLGPTTGVALVGVVLWGLGTALGFPTGMSAAADDPARAAGRVSTVATIGYVAFLAGPSLIGTIGDHTGVRRALAVTAVLLGVGAAIASSTRPLDAPTDDARRSPVPPPAASP